MASTLPGGDAVFGARTAPRPSTAVSQIGPTGLEGRSAQNLSQAAGEMGEATKYLAKAQDEYDTLEAENAYNKYQEKLVDEAYGENGWTKVKGRDASDPAFQKKYEERFTASREEIAASMESPRAQLKFNQRAAVGALRSRASLMEHASKERVQYQGQVWEKGVENELNDMWRSYGDATVFKGSLERLEGTTREYARTQGMSEEATKDVVGKIKNKAYRQRFDAAIAADDTSKAKEIRDESTGILDSTTKLHMDEKLKGAVADQKSTVAVDTAWQTFGPKPNADGAYNYNAPLPMFQMEEKIRADLASDPAARDKAISSLRSKAQGFNAQQTELRNGNIGVVDSKLYIDKVPLAEVMKMPEWKLLSGIDQSTVAKGFVSYQAAEESRALTREQRALTRDQKVTPDQLAIFDRLVGMRFNDPDKFRSLSVADMTGAGLKNPGLIHNIITAKDGVLKKDENEEQKKVRINSAMGEIKSMTEAIPGLSAKARKTSEEARGRYDMFTGMFDRAITDWRNLNSGKNPSSAELRQIAAPLLAEVEVPGSVWGTNTKRAFDVLPTEQVVGFNIPKNAQASLEVQFEAKFKRKPNMSNAQDKAFFQSAYRLGLESGYDWNRGTGQSATGKIK
jgi:hypothetical protein